MTRVDYDFPLTGRPTGSTRVRVTRIRYAPQITEVFFDAGLASHGVHYSSYQRARMFTSSFHTAFRVRPALLVSRSEHEFLTD
jgi:hypothetical protein